MLLSRKLLFYQNQFPREYFIPGEYFSTMLPGTYEIIIRGAGGAGGVNGGASNVGSGGIGGAGSSGSLTRVILSVQNVTTATVYVGEKGTLSGDNYNGGTGGAGGSGGAGGIGGGGGKPSYILINNSLFDAESGSGGGGGGGCGRGDGRNADGGGGGGGGGRYKIQRSTYSITAKRNIQLNWATVDGTNIIKEVTDPVSEGLTLEIQTGEELYVGKTWVRSDSMVGDYTYTLDNILPNGDIVLSSSRSIDNAVFGPSTISNTWTNDIILKSIAGKKGADYNNGGNGINGTAGNTAEFPNVFSGGGGAGYGHAGSNGAYGGGASGGSGGDAGNHSGRSAGSGGGGAGGDTNAGGGTSGSSRPGGSGSNSNATPVDTTSENALYGITGDYGTGGTTATEGKDGFVVIRQVFIVGEIINLGLVQITSVPSITDNAGDITGTIEESDDAGAITGAVEDTDSAGSIYEQIPATSIWNLGSITDSVTETKNCGSII